MQRETRNLTREECAQALILFEEGWNYRRIGRRFNVYHTTVSRVIERFRDTGSHGRRPGQGRNRITTPIEDRFLRLSALRQRFVTARTLQTQLRDATGLQVCGETVRQRLREHNLRPRIAARGPALTRDHRRARLNFAREHLNWLEAEWQQVLFTDESRFCLYNNDRRIRVYGRTNERYAQCNFSNTTLFGGGSVMVWGGISLTGRTELVVINNGSLTAERYILEILDQHVMPFAPYIGQGFLLMQDNARPHVAGIVRNYLEEVGIDTMAWPARSPDLNPIENLWDTIGRRLREERNLNTLEDVGRRLIEIWEEIDQNDIRSLILSMGRRCQAVISARGGNTRY